MSRLRSPEVRVKFALVLLIVCVIGWPVTSITVFAGEPQAVMGLSWVALIMTSLNILATTDVRRATEESEED